jgi:anti-anti-sigma factor
VHHRAVFTAHRDAPSTAVVTVEGEIDASNSRELASYVQRHITGSTHVVLDLRLVDFLGTAGFAALHNINVICSGSDAPACLLAAPTWRRFHRQAGASPPDDLRSGRRPASREGGPAAHRGSVITSTPPEQRCAIALK